MRVRYKYLVLKEPTLRPGDDIGLYVLHADHGWEISLSAARDEWCVRIAGGVATVSYDAVSVVGVGT